MIGLISNEMMKIVNRKLTWIILFLLIAITAGSQKELWNNLIFFRDYLNSNEAARKQYLEIKLVILRILL